MGKVTISNYKPLIGADPSFGPDYSAKTTCTTQTDFEEEVKNIKWLWPYKIRQEGIFRNTIDGPYTVTIGGVNYPGGTIINLSDKYARLLFIIPIEYRLATNAELVGLYPSLAGWNEFLKEKVIFYDEYFSDGTRKTGFTKPYGFFSKYELEEEK